MKAGYLFVIFGLLLRGQVDSAHRLHPQQRHFTAKDAKGREVNSQGVFLCDPSRPLRLLLFTIYLLAASAIANTALADETLGRLFYTPEERAALELARQGHRQDNQAAIDTRQGVTLEGIVKRSDGKATVWINGRAQEISPSSGLINGTGRAGASVQLPQGGQRLKLKVGQSYDPSTGKIVESYQRPKPAPAAPGQPSPDASTKPSEKTPATPKKNETKDTEGDTEDQTPQAAPQ